jgi:hypothetical protein
VTDPTLHPVLDRASDGVRPTRSPQHAASAALVRAHVVRRRRRAGGLVGAVVAAVVVAVAVLGVPGNRAEPPIAPAPTAPPAHGVADDDVQPELDPRTAGSLPQLDSVLPTSVAPPSAVADLGRLPTSSPVRLVLGAGRSRLLLLGEDDTWTATRTPSEEASTTGISDDGTMLASIGPKGLWVVDVREGTWRELALPDETSSWWTGLGTRVQWQGDRVVLSNLGQLLTVPVDGGAPDTAPLTSRRIVPTTGFVPLGADRALVLGARRGGGGPVVAEVEGGRLERIVPTAALERLFHPVVTEDRIAATVNGIPREDRTTDRAGVLVADRGTFDATAYLPIAGTRYRPGIGVDTPGGITAWGWLGGDTVLLGTDPHRIAPWRLLAWDVTSGEVSLVATGEARTQLVDVAGGLLGR